LKKHLDKNNPKFNNRSDKKRLKQEPGKSGSTKKYSGTIITGTIISTSRGRCKVLYEDRVLDCLLRIHPQDSPTVGDEAAVSCREYNTYIIEELLHRRTVLSRRNPRSATEEQVIAANIDTAVIVASVVSPPLRIKLIDRYFIAVQRSKIEPIICVNKIDLLEGRTMPDELKTYSELGIDVVPCSAAGNIGIDDLKRLLAGKTCVFVGHSGVGKSSLVNAINPSLELMTNTVRKSDLKGRHTTTASTLYQLTDDIRVIDTPGVREFGLWDVKPEELKWYFPEFEDFSMDCKFTDCSHTDEPECGVKTAVRDGKISRSRYESYLRLLSDDTDGQPVTNKVTAFECSNCGASVSTEGAGSEHRNHCPQCLYSLHLDNEPGDRAACCGGLMEPVAVWVKKCGEWAIIHRCRDCGELSSNRVAADDNEMLLLSLAVKPLSKPPFPLERFE
jgi:ribosome biogenesis GTPase